MRRQSLLLCAALVLVTSACSSTSSYVANEEKRYIYSPNRTYAAIVADRTVVQKRFWYFRGADRRETIVSVVRGETPYTERAMTGPNPERTFLAATCPSSSFALSWADDSRIDVAVQGCAERQMNKKDASAGMVSVNYM